ncbi:MAG: metal-dependent hydrolase [Chloroflexota bacterium]|nr:metal-dependent hydrolase [Chloroflexota bacterium]
MNGDDVTFIWYGHSCIEAVSPAGLHVLIDPWFANPRSPRAADEVERCDVLLVTHGHFDHFGDALSIARRTRPVWPCIHEMSLWVSPQLPEAGDALVGFNKGGTVDARGIKVTMVAADHSAGDVAPSGEPVAETPIYLGEPAGFVVELENGFRFYHAGDTSLFNDFDLIGQLYRPELAFLPIGGHYTMGPAEAAVAAGRLGVARVVPIHYGTFPILAGTPDQLRQELASRGLTNVSVLAPAPGEALPL